MYETQLDVLVRTVSASAKEYEQGLRQAVPNGVSGGPHSFTIVEGSVTIEVQIEVQPDFVIALMRLPSLIATWTFISGSQSERKAVLDRIDWSMKRGGG
jgi:hypothetical protein